MPVRIAARLRVIALAWIPVSLVGLVLNFFTTCIASSPRPCTADYPDFALSARLALLGHARDAYDFVVFQARVMRDFPHARDIYQFAYPPFLLLLTAPLGLVPFWAGWLLWIGGGWLVFALCVKRMFPARGWLYAAALPALFVNGVAGQNGFWTGSIIGWGLLLLPARPVAAGAILALMLYKPQIAVLVPLALLASGNVRALAGFAGSAALLGGAATAAYGVGIWADFWRHDQVVRALILENGTGIWHRMVSLLVLLLHLGVPARVAYVAQAGVSLIVAALVMACWRGGASPAIRNAVLVLGMPLAAPYVFDYDLVPLALVPLWLLPADTGALLACGLLVLLPIAAAPLAFWSGIALGGFLLVPAFVLAVRESFNNQRR